MLKSAILVEQGSEAVQKARIPQPTVKEQAKAK
jgi:hypothetical protein